MTPQGQLPQGAMTAPPQSSPQDDIINQASSVFEPVMNFVNASGVTGQTAENLKQAIAAFIQEAISKTQQTPQAPPAAPMQ